jgi:hypothetical protein
VEHSFKECSQNPERFFSSLPADWQEGIIPFWNAYQHSARVFILESSTELLGGGIVFSTPSPDTHPHFQQQAQRWFDEGYLYVGFLWISEQHRDKQLGSAWLQSLFRLFPQQKFWLSIEEFRLASFYLRNGFSLVQHVSLGESEEWVLAMHGKEMENHSLQTSNPLLAALVVA